MKTLFLTTLALFALLTSCDKEDVQPQPEEPGNTISQHYAYIKGTFTDSLTGAPITGYDIELLGPIGYRDTLADGTYDLTVYWFYSKYSFPKPTNVEIMMIDANHDIVKYVNFDGNLLIEDDTVVVDFQVNL